MKHLLIDTHTLLWYLNGDPQLSMNAHALISDVGNERWISLASIWEIAIKVCLGKLHLNRSFPDLQTFLSTNGFLWLPIEYKYAIQVSVLPHFHGDPFDRMLIAQALVENFEVVTKDPNFTPYGVATIW